MSTLFLECEVTEHYATPPKENQNVNFCFHEKAVLINLMDVDDKLMLHTEISKEDAIELAKTILMKYEK
jgi:hypothetical protein